MSYKTKILTVMAAVVAVAMMLAVPVFTAVDTDAAFTNDKAGYSVVLTDPSDAELTSLGLDKAEMLLDGLGSGMQIFDTSLYGEPTVTADSFGATTAQGQKITDDSRIYTTVSNVEGKNVKITLTALAAGKLISSSTTEWSDEMKTAASKIAEYIGPNINIGDKIEITGKIREETAYQMETEYKLLDGNKCIIDKAEITTYGFDDTDVTLKVTFASDGSSKEIQYRSTVKGTAVSKNMYEYKDEDIKVGTKYETKWTVDTAFSGDTYFKVDGKDYTLVSDDVVPAPGEGTVTEYDFIDQSLMVVSPFLKEEIENLPESSDGVSVDKTYSGLESAYDGVIMDAVGNDILKTILIIVGVVIGVIVLIVILIIVLIVLKKKKK